ncbi:hypothetical protein M0802_003906 [Mischocyttarus mexicanus]|nr:hypothetical protein M0802_003906 [Mischocyttarus mexicanus]
MDHRLKLCFVPTSRSDGDGDGGGGGGGGSCGDGCGGGRSGVNGGGEDIGDSGGGNDDNDTVEELGSPDITKETEGKITSEKNKLERAVCFQDGLI